MEERQATIVPLVGSAPPGELPVWDATQTRILDAADELILRRGVHGVTIAELARRAGHSRPTIYRSWSDADDVVPISATEQIVAELRSLDADVRFTRYAGVGHDSWTETYANPEFYDWLLSHRRVDPDTEGTAR